MKRIKSQSLVFYIFIFFIAAFEILLHSVYFPIKGDIFDVNFSTVDFLDRLSREGLFELPKYIFTERLNKGTHLLLLNLPFFAMGFDHILTNRMWIFVFNMVLFISLYRAFLFRSKPWVSVISALVIVSCELIFKNINEYDTFMPFYCSLPAVYVFGERLRLGWGNRRLNSVGLVIFMFFCIGARPFESFFVALAAVIMAPALLRSRAVWMGFLVGGTWWLLDFEKISRYWNSTQTLLSQPQNNLDYSRIFNSTTIVVIFLLVTAMVLFLKKRQPVSLVTKISAGSGFLICLALFKFNMVETDYLQIPLFLFLFAAVNMINQMESSLKFQWRASVMACVAVIFFVDQASAILNGYSKLGLGRQVPRLDRLHKKDWQEMSRYFSKDVPVSVAVVYNHRYQAGDHLRPMWGTLQTLAYRDGYKVTFSDVDEYFPIKAPVGVDHFCLEGHSYVMVMRFTDGKPNPDVEREQFRYKWNVLPANFQEGLPDPLFSFPVSSDVGVLIKPHRIELIKLSCDG